MEKYKIFFGGSPPGEPGPGDWTDIEPIEFDYEGNDPEGEIERLRIESYTERGILPDLRSWFERISDIESLKIESPKVWKGLFNRYKEVNFFQSPSYKSIMNRPSGSITNIREIPDGQNTIFEDLEFVTYFYNFSSQDLEHLTSSDKEKRKKLGFYTGQYELEHEVINNSAGVLIYRSRSDETPIGKKLEQLVGEGKKITHVVCAEESYGGDTHYSVWRDYKKAEVYEVVGNE